MTRLTRIRFKPGQAPHGDDVEYALPTLMANAIERQLKEWLAQGERLDDHECGNLQVYVRRPGEASRTLRYASFPASAIDGFEPIPVDS